MSQVCPKTVAQLDFTTFFNALALTNSGYGYQQGFVLNIEIVRWLGIESVPLYDDRAMTQQSPNIDFFLRITSYFSLDSWIIVLGQSCLFNHLFTQVVFFFV